jgi:hypothetical protein
MHREFVGASGTHRANAGIGSTQKAQEQSGLTISRLNLDGAGSPAALVTRILQLEPALAIPVPIEQLCWQFDIPTNLAIS